jgi:hypothetical protein
MDGGVRLLLPIETDVMTLAEQFQTVVRDLFQARAAGPDLLPMVLAQACVAVLPVSGAGLSMTDGLRVPLAASDEMAALAERLQTTLGEGPCLSAVTSGEFLVAGSAAIAERWPTFSHEFLTETPYRSVASVPLRSVGGIRLGALDLYSVDPQPLDEALMADISVGVAAPIASMVFREPLVDDEKGFASPGWLDSDAVADRMNVWVAVGMVMERLDRPNSDALAVLRGYAFSHDYSLDEVAREVTEQRLRLDQLLL